MAAWPRNCLFNVLWVVSTTCDNYQQQLHVPRRMRPAPIFRSTFSRTVSECGVGVYDYIRALSVRTWMLALIVYAIVAIRSYLRTWSAMVLMRFSVPGPAWTLMNIAQVATFVRVMPSVSTLTVRTVASAYLDSRMMASSLTNVLMELMVAVPVQTHVILH